MSLSVHGIMYSDQDFSHNEKQLGKGYFLDFTLYSLDTAGKRSNWRVAMWVPPDGIGDWRHKLRPCNAYYLQNAEVTSEVRSDSPDKVYSASIKAKHTDLKAVQPEALQRFLGGGSSGADTAAN